MIKTFKTGDSVVNKASSKIMTINYRTKNGLYNCRWYEGMTLQEAEFDPANLVLRDRKSPTDLK